MPALSTPARKQYRASISSSCPVCNEGVRRGMPIVYVSARGPFHDYPSARSTVAIHALCEHVHDLGA